MGYSFYRYIKAVTGGVEITASGGQSLIEVTHSASVTHLKGADAGGDELRITSNQTDTYPRLRMIGTDYVNIAVPSTKAFYIMEELVQIFQSKKEAPNDYGIRGGGVTGDDLTIGVNSIDAQPYIFLEGDANMLLSVKAGSKFYFQEGGANFFTIAESTDSVLGTTTNRDLYLAPDGTGLVKFGTHVGTGDVVSNGHIIINDAGGTPRKLMTTA